MFLEENNINLLEKYFVKLKKLIQDDKLSIKIIFLPHEYQTRVNNCKGSYLIPQISVKKILKKVRKFLKKLEAKQKILTKYV